MSTRVFVSSIVLLLIVSCGVHLSRNSIDSQHPNWVHIKRNARPLVALPDEYGEPYLQPHSTLAWEDGVFISRDGLHMYAFYAPTDIVQYAKYLTENGKCPDITSFLRGPELGMDLSTNPWGVDGVLHSDISYASRGSTSDTFSSWKLSKIANPYRFDGGFQALSNADGTIDAVVSISTDENSNDIFWARGVQHNPPFSSFSLMSINTHGQEDNPHLERLDSHTLVLLFDNHGIGNAVTSIKYSLSVDSGGSWSAPLDLGGNINTGTHDLQGHLYHDANTWWLYFTSEREGKTSIFRSRHNDSRNIQTDFDSWGAAELVISPGVILDGSGIIAGVGEPTLTSNGDISFVVVYSTDVNSSRHDRFEVDPWYLPRKR